MTTPVQLINLALKQAGVLGVGQTATSEDISDAFKIMNMMLAQWSVKRNVVYRIVDLSVTSTGQATYTVGIGGDISAPRPAKIVGAYCRQTINAAIPIDYPLQLLLSQTDWGRISTKTQASMPNVVFYDPQFPLGVLYVWPVATIGYELHIQALMPLAQFATAYDDINLPAEYEEAIMYNLAGRLFPMYGLPLDQTIIRLASASLATIRMANIQVGKLYMPSTLTQARTYNVYSDN